MMKILKNIGWALVFFMLISSCQKDDICPAASETTPRLVIEFYDVEDPTALNAVRNLMVIALEKEDTLLGPSTVNQVEIPLRTDRNSTTYRFIRNAGADDEEVEDNLRNEDTITFSYDPTTEYLNRACGFKVNFLGLTTSRPENGNGENWINSIDITADENNIVNDSTTHIHFIH